MEALAALGAPDGPPKPGPKEKKGPAPTKQNQYAQVQAVHTAVSKLTMNYPLVNAVVLVQSGLGNNWAISRCDGPEASQLVGLSESIIQQVQQQRILGQGKKVPFLYEHEELGPLNARDMALGEKCVTVCGAPMIEAQTLGLASRPSPPLLRDTQPLHKNPYCGDKSGLRGCGIP